MRQLSAQVEEAEGMAGVVGNRQEKKGEKAKNQPELSQSFLSSCLFQRDTHGVSTERTETGRLVVHCRNAVVCRPQ